MRAQKADLVKRGKDLRSQIAELETEARDPRGGGFRIGAHQQAGADECLSRDTIAMVDVKITEGRAKRDAARTAVNQAELIGLRKLEKQQMIEVIKAAETFWQALQPIMGTWQKEAGLGGSAPASATGGRTWIAFRDSAIRPTSLFLPTSL